MLVVKGLPDVTEHCCRARSMCRFSGSLCKSMAMLQGEK